MAASRALALAACQNRRRRAGGASRDQIRVVGSSTVYPFTTAVAEQFARKNAGLQGADRRIDRHRRRHEAVLRRRRRAVPRHRQRLAPDQEVRVRRSAPERRQARSSRSRSASTASCLAESKDGPSMQLTAGRHLQGARRRAVRQAADRQDLEGRQPGAAGDRDRGARPAADLRHARRLRRADHG